MDLRPDMSVGDRLKVARRASGLTQEQLADQASVNVDTIRKLEQNKRQSMRVSTANALANTLGVETTALLLGQPPSQPANDSALLQIRQALAPAHDFAPAADSPEEDAPPDLTALRHSVEDAWTSYHAGEFDTLNQVLPQLITEARIAAHESTNGATPQALSVLAKTLQLGAHTMVQTRREDLGLLALDRARIAAQRSGDPLLPAMMLNSVAWIFLRTGRLDDSEHIAVSAADSIEPTFRKSALTHVATYGGLLLSAATAAARNQRPGTARDLIQVARSAAHRVGDDSTDRWTTVFGPTSVAMQAVSLEAAAGEWGTALTLARQVPLSGQVPTSWKVRFLLDVAHAQTETYRDTDAVETLRTARRLAPTWTQRHGLATAIVRELLTHKHPARGINPLADFLGVAH
jgi:transcriptional regulator with XRE-family HTH domain